MNRKHSFRSNEFRLRNSAPVAGRICDIILLRHSAFPGGFDESETNKFPLKRVSLAKLCACGGSHLRHYSSPPQCVPPEGLMNRKHSFRFIKKGAAITGYTLLLKKIAKERTPVLSPTFIS